MNTEVAKNYDKIYTKDRSAYSNDPLPSVLILADLLKRGGILEIGASTGRNSVYLATRGFTVTATDISTRGIEIITENAAQAKVVITTQILDIDIDEPTKTYNGVICTFVLQHLEVPNAHAAITRMQDHTIPGGYNLICAFTKNGDFYRANPDTAFFYLENKEALEEIYNGWKIIHSFEHEGKARATHANGSPQFNVFAGIIAQKIYTETSCNEKKGSFFDFSKTTTRSCA